MPDIKTKTMNIRAIIQKIRKSFNHREQLPSETVLEFMHVLESVQEEGCSCDEVFSKIDEYVEHEVNKEDVEELMPLIREHLDLCPDCCEEYEALLDVLEKTSREQK